MTLTYESTSRFVQAGETRIHYHEAGSGPVLLCIHGGAPGAFGWGNLGRNLEALAAHHRVLIVDLPGYGRSDKPQIASGRQAFYARTFKQMLEALGIEKANILGMATGGAVGIRMAVDYPQIVDRLILVSAAGGHSNYSVKPLQTPSQAYFAGEGPTYEKMRTYLEQLIYDHSLITDEIIRERYEASVDPDFIDQAPEGRTKERHTPPDLWKNLDKIQAETLIVWGRENRSHTFENAVFMHKCIARSQLHVFGGCGLWVPYEKMKAFNQLVLDFLG